MSLQIPVNDQVSQEEEAEEEESITSSGEVISADNKELSVDVETASSHCGIPTLVLRHIWAKAIDLLNSNQVLPAPGCAVQDRMVASTSKKKPLQLKMAVLNVMKTALTSCSITSVRIV